MSTTWLIIAIAAVFILVLYNNKRNIHKLRDRQSRNFKDNYYKKKKAKDENIHKDGR